MENKHNIPVPVLKIEELLKDITKLQFNIGLVYSVKEELNSIENEEKLENHKRNVFEVRKDCLCQSIKFYQNKAVDLRNSLSRKLVKHSKFSMASECYDKLLATYTEKYLQNDTSQILCKQSSDNNKSNLMDFQKHVEILQKQTEDYNKIIEKNFQLTKSLLEELQQPM